MCHHVSAFSSLCSEKRSKGSGILYLLLFYCNNTMRNNERPLTGEENELMPYQRTWKTKEDKRRCYLGKQKETRSHCYETPSRWCPSPRRAQRSQWPLTSPHWWSTIPRPSPPFYRPPVWHQSGTNQRQGQKKTMRQPLCDMCLIFVDVEYHSDRGFIHEMSSVVWGHFQTYQIKKSITAVVFTALPIPASLKPSWQFRHPIITCPILSIHTFIYFLPAFRSCSVRFL